MKDVISLSTYARACVKMLKTGEAHVPCNGCTACCHEIPCKIYENEAAAFPEAVRGEDGRLYLPKREDGSCVHLVNEKCSIYARRPRACRGYDCRITILFGIQNYHPRIAAAQQRFAFTIRTRDEKRDILHKRIAAWIARIHDPNAGEEEVVAFYARIVDDPKQERSYTAFINEVEERIDAWPAADRNELYEKLGRLANIQSSPVGAMFSNLLDEVMQKHVRNRPVL